MIGQSLQFQSRCFSIFKVVERTSGDFSKKWKTFKIFCVAIKKIKSPFNLKIFQPPFSLPSWHMMWIFWISQSGHFFSMAFKGIQNLKKTHFNLIMVIFKKLIFTTYQNSAIPAIWSYVSSAAFLFEFYLSSSNTNHQSLIFNYVLLLCLVVSEINDKQSCKKSRWLFIPRSIDPELVKEKINSFKFFIIIHFAILSL